jgi:hypothetical protein
MSDIPQMEPNFGESETYNWLTGRVYRLKNTDSVLARNPDGTNAFSNLPTQALVNRTRNLHVRLSAVESPNWVTENRIADGAVTRRKIMAGARAIATALNINPPFNHFLLRDYPNESNVYGNPFGLSSGGSITPFVKVYRDISNRVFLEGFFNKPATGTPTGTLFTLPNQFRPSTRQVFSLPSFESGSAIVVVLPTGQVQLTHWTSGTYAVDYPLPVPLNPICFMALEDSSEFGGPPA